jgi:AcrR family transcriptional regulator
MLIRDPDTTRRSILEAAFEEIRLHGFQAASLSRILDKTDVTKGALYHHFPDKKALGYAVVDEILDEMVRRKWIEPLAQGNPIDAMLQTLHTEGCEIARDKVFIGCPLNNLAQEISALDTGFRKRLARLFGLWRGGISAALQRGQAEGCVRRDVDTDAAATFIVAAIEGCLGMAKSGNDINLLYECGAGLTHYLETLRTPGARKPVAARAARQQKRR